MSAGPKSKRAKMYRGLAIWVGLGVVNFLAWRLVMDGTVPRSMHAMVLMLGTACGISAGFMACMFLLRHLLALPIRSFGVAQSFLREATHNKIAIVLLVLMLLIIAGLPFIVGETDRLQYRIQQFLSYSLGLTGILLSLLTILLACATLSSEIRDKQIFTVMVKPIDRGSYLLGKWIGIVLLNAVLLLVAGGAIYGFVTVYLFNQPARDQLDALAVTEQVLTARVAAQPTPPEEADNEVAKRLNRLLDDQSDAYIEQRGGMAAVEQEIRQQVLTEWRSLGPYGRTRYQSIYVFTDMAKAKQIGRSVQLEYKIKVSGEMSDRQTRIWWGANGRMLTPEPRQVPANIKQTELIPVDWIDETGRLELLAVNANPQASISFPAEDGMQLLYTVDRFGPNFARGMVMIWFKLAFLAALGLAAATFLGFPVAALSCVLVFAAASASHFILESLRYFGSPQSEVGVRIVSVVMKWIATGFTVPLEKYGQFRPIGSLVEGRYIAWGAVGGCALWIGLLWTGVAGLAGWLIFQRKELARVQV
jgi:hypothetical protein